MYIGKQNSLLYFQDLLKCHISHNTLTVFAVCSRFHSRKIRQRLFFNFQVRQRSSMGHEEQLVRNMTLQNFMRLYYMAAAQLQVINLQMVLAVQNP